MKSIFFIKPNNKRKFVENLSTVIIVSMLVVLYFFTININAAFVFNLDNNQVIYNGNRNSNKISIMFNVYWGSEFIADILDVLDNYEIKTTFFVGGVWAKKETELLHSIIERGHEIGNHGYRHADQDKLNYEGNFDEINNTHQIIKNNHSIEMKLFAPPSGAFNQATLQAATNLGYATIMWSKDTVDWRDKDEKTIFSRATKNVIGGDLILAHPTQKTLLALPSIFEYYKLHNISATTVSLALT